MARLKFIKTVRRPYPPFYVSLIWEGFCNKEVWETFLGFKYGTKNAVLTDSTWFYTSRHMVDFPQKVTKLLFLNPKLFTKIKTESIKREKNFLASVNKEFSEFCQAYIDYMPTLGLFFVCDDIIEKKVKSLLSRKISSEEVYNLMHFLTMPQEDNFYKKETVDLVKSKNIKNHVKKYVWINSRYGLINPYTLAQAKTKLKRINVKEFLKDYNKEKRGIRQAIKKAKENIPANKRHIIDIMQFFIYYRTQRTDIMNKVAFLYYKKLIQLAKKLGLTYKELLYCTYYELESNKIPPKKIIQKRIKAFTFIIKNGKFKILIGKDNDRLVKKYMLTKEKVKLIKGRVAYHGKIKGKVIVIKTRSDFKKFKKSNILVTSMTTTEMMPLLNKASAIITNEGGITCHAAIVSRELKIPTIIGTKIATNVLRDGDKVLVDADQGIVKKL